ncbi:hypothetical protein [Kiloniella sp. b19]|uniref:hypothetical protein n=1 Tax=Kiloniella sp. GXU_MW_B19 TaxID=3141326 RepID=UPI0031D9A3A5
MRYKHSDPTDNGEGIWPTFIGLIVGAVGTVLLLLAVLAPITGIILASVFASSSVELDLNNEKNFGVSVQNSGVIEIKTLTEFENQSQFTETVRQHLLSVIDRDRRYVLDMLIDSADASGEGLMALHSGQQVLLQVMQELGIRQLSDKPKILIGDFNRNEFIYRLTPEIEEKQTEELFQD